jgi:pimeloyl-ACP methyl ester carboxylesterase
MKKETVVLLHGWNYKNYTKFKCSDAWENREKFIDSLSIRYDIIKINLPGFCGTPEPKNAWNIDDFADHFNTFLEKNRIEPDYVLGYSFGASIALNWKLKYKKSNKIILVSPAILRAYVEKGLNKFLRLKGIMPRRIRYFLRDIYLKNLKNPYYINGTKYLKETYLNIVKLDLTDTLLKTNPNEVLLIFGSDDSATPYNLISEKLMDNPLKQRVHIIKGGGHDIANTHTDELVDIVKNFSRNGN